jgi:hypothetical protein
MLARIVVSWSLLSGIAVQAQVAVAPVEVPDLTATLLKKLRIDYTEVCRLKISDRKSVGFLG